MADGNQQRRLATILAADVAGYSRLMAEDEEYALRALKAHRNVIDRLIARHEGRIFNTAGDSVVAEFGSAVEAVRCAITIQEELRVRNAQIDENRRMDFRIGINVGDVLVDDGNLYGDGVNIAARLESIAAPGNICISGSVFALVKNKLSYGFEDIGPQLVKNIPEPVPAFRLTSDTTTSPPARINKRLLLAGAAGILLLIGFGGWAFTTFRSSETARPSSQRAAVKVAPSDAGTAFDGTWEFQLAGGDHCRVKSVIFRRKISNGIISTPDGRDIGSISKDGSFRFSNPSRFNKSLTINSQGTIKGDTGSGNYLVVDSLCEGTYQIHLVNKLNN
jgi:class 3 adenylate cyclase